MCTTNYAKYRITGNSRGRKLSQFDNWKLVSKKIFAIDKNFNAKTKRSARNCSDMASKM